MKDLPIGYYAVTNSDNYDTFTFKEVTYSVEKGINVFSSLEEAFQNANDVPESVISGLDYSQFNTPVILFSEGTHKVEKFEIAKPITLLGQNAGISPNVKVEGNSMPAENEARKVGETLLLGHYWFGYIDVWQELVTEVTFDGLSLKSLRFNDRRRQGDHSLMSFKNIIHLGSCGRHVYYFEEISKTSPFVREVILENCRVTNADAYDYGENFILGNITSLTVKGVCCDKTCPRFGITNITRSVPSYSKYGNATKITLSDCYFSAIKDDGCISFSAVDAGDSVIRAEIVNCAFINALGVNTTPIIGHLENEGSSLLIKDCKFENPSNNGIAAVALYGDEGNITLENSVFEGYSSIPKRLPTSISFAPDHIDTSMRETETDDPHALTEGNFEFISSAYEGKKAYYGDLHVHTNCGGTSDGKFPMADWPCRMDEIGVDFAAVVDHKQMRGFFLPEWDEKRFIIGTEPAGTVTDSNACIDAPNATEFHYNMLFKDKNDLALVLANFPEYGFKGDRLTGKFEYPDFTKQRISELVSFIHSIGGMFVHPHPKTMLASLDPTDYYFGEYTYLETLYGTYESNASFKNYDLWVTLLNMGKKVFTSGGSDTHGNPSNKVVSVFYSDIQSGDAFFDIMKSGDFTVGAVGMKMSISGHKMGSTVKYEEGMELTLVLDDFYKNELKENTAYELRIYTDKGLCYASTFNGKKCQKLAIKVQKRRYYRAEVFDITHGYRVAIGNPIWLEY